MHVKLPTYVETEDVCGGGGGFQGKENSVPERDPGRKTNKNPS